MRSFTIAPLVDLLEVANTMRPDRDENDSLRSVEIRLSVIRLCVRREPFWRDYMVNIVLIAKHVVRIGTSRNRAKLMDVNRIVMSSSLASDILIAATSFRDRRRLRGRSVDNRRILSHLATISQDALGGGDSIFSRTHSRRSLAGTRPVARFAALPTFRAFPRVSLRSRCGFRATVHPALAALDRCLSATATGRGPRGGKMYKNNENRRQAEGGVKRLNGIQILRMMIKPSVRQIWRIEASTEDDR
ncbi:hypothetical protein EL22_04890 [Halostagnicola sp. A56]|nr:hypothetical protein EL22_04890 [Halostagnicola sp. A56]